MGAALTWLLMYLFVVFIPGYLGLRHTMYRTLQAKRVAGVDHLISGVPKEIWGFLSYKTN